MGKDTDSMKAPTLSEMGDLTTGLDTVAERLAQASTSTQKETPIIGELDHRYTWGTGSAGNATADEAMKAITEGMARQFQTYSQGHIDSPYTQESKITFLQHTNGCSMYKLVWNKLAIGIVFLDNIASVGIGEQLAQETLISKYKGIITKLVASTEPSTTLYADTVLLTPRCVADIDQVVTSLLLALNGMMVACDPSMSPVTVPQLIKHFNRVTDSRNGRMVTSSATLTNTTRRDGLGHIPGLSVQLSYQGESGATEQILTVAVKPSFHSVNTDKGTIQVPTMVITDIVSTSVLTAPEIHIMAHYAVYRELVLTYNWVHVFVDKKMQKLLFEIADYKQEATYSFEDLRAVASEMFPQVVIAVDEIIGYPQIAGVDGLVPSEEGKPCFMAYRASQFFGVPFDGYAAFATDVDAEAKSSLSSWILAVGVEPDTLIDSRSYGLVDLILRDPTHTKLAADVALATCGTERDAMRVYRSLVQLTGTLPDVPQFVVKRHMYSDAYTDQVNMCMGTAFNWANSPGEGPAHGVTRRVRESNYGANAYRGMSGLQDTYVPFMTY